QRVLEFQDRVLYGSDFPNIPYPLADGVQAILDLRLGRALEEKILCTNAARLLGLDPAKLAEDGPDPANHGHWRGRTQRSRWVPCNASHRSHPARGIAGCATRQSTAVRKTTCWSGSPVPRTCAR